MALRDIIAEHADLSEAESAHLAALVGEWQLLADLAFADLLLLCPSRSGGGLAVVAQMRPYTAQTLHQDDQVGRLLTDEEAPFTTRAIAEGRIVREGDPVWRAATPVRVEAVPVRFGGRTIAVISQQQNLATARTPSRLELTYVQTAGELAQMIAEGTFPFPSTEPDPEAMPRVGDGLLRLDPDGRIEYASPNAISAYRRLGVTDNLVERAFAELDPSPEGVLRALASRAPTDDEVERRGTVVLRRALPLVVGGSLAGALVLLRDVTELRHRDRMLQLKDATIQEIHHRVKNNLQTVASLLRLQSRRLESPEARSALAESERRIRSIALVHETLSLERGELADFDQVVAQVVEMIRDGLAGPNIEMAVDGSCGEISAEIATPLAVVVTELVQNAVEHAFDEGGGRVGVILRHGDQRIGLEVWDDGRGLPAGFAVDGPTGLGFQLVRTLVEAELGGRLSIGRDGDGLGTRVTVEVPAGGRGAARG